jgi:hypothetical protein
MQVKNRIPFLAVALMLSFGLIAGFTGCKSKKINANKGDAQVVMPFTGKKYQTDKNHFRAVQSGTSPDLSTAKKMALMNAKTEMAGNIQTLIKAVTENYTNQRSIADKQEFENKFEENARAVVNQTLNNVVTVDEKVFKAKDGKYTYWIGIEMNKDGVVDGLYDRISKDRKLQLDFDKYRFQKIFDEEMQKYEESVM